MSYHTIVGIRGRPPPTLLPWQHLIGNKTLSGHPTMEREVAKAPNSCLLTQVREAMERVAREAMAKEGMAKEAREARASVATTVEHQIMDGGNALNHTMQLCSGAHKQHGVKTTGGLMVTMIHHGKVAPRVPLLIRQWCHGMRTGKIHHK